VETAKRKIAEIEAAMVTAKSQLAEAEANIVQARGALKQAADELERREEIQSRSPGSISETEVALEKTLVVAGTDGILQQFALRPGDVVNPMLRPAGILVSERAATALLAGFGQIEAQVVEVGMIGEVTCTPSPGRSSPWS
jgi:multidrug resistance efflux pump